MRFLARLRHRLVLAMMGLAARRHAASLYRQSARQFRDGAITGAQDPDAAQRDQAMRQTRESYERQRRRG